MRSEYTDRNLNQLTGKKDYPYQKFDIYPSVYLTYYLPYNQQVQLSYSKRVDRPRSYMLNPYPFFSDAFNSFEGNPALEPEFAHSLEFNYQKYFGYSYLTIETYYRLTKNKMTRVRVLNDQGVLESTVENLNHDQAIGVEANANIRLTDWLSINPIADIYDYRLADTTSDTSIIKRSTNWNASLELAADLQTGTKIRLDGYYNSPTVTVDNTRSVPVVVYLERGDLDTRVGKVAPDTKAILPVPKYLGSDQDVRVWVQPENGIDLSSQEVTVPRVGTVNVYVPRDNDGYIAPPVETIPNPGVGTTTLTVLNSRASEVTVSVEHGEFDTTIGTVPADDVRTLTVPAWLVRQPRDVTIFVQPKNGFDMATQEVTLKRGSHLEVKVPLR